MKILLVNKFYYRRGGDCIVLLNTLDALRRRGHDVAVYAMQHPLNEPSDYSSYFADGCDMGGSKVKAFRRIMGMDGVKKSFARLLDDFGPDVVHLHNIHSYLSPVVARVAHDRGIRVVWTMHDYKLVCPAYSCLRTDNQVCGQCVGGDKWNVVRNKCMKGSTAASLAGWAEARRWNRNTLEQCTDTFICPSRFMAKMMEKDGFDASKLTVIGNFVNAGGDVITRREPYYCYVGRLSAEKGVSGLIEVARMLPYTLKIAGTGPDEQRLREQASGCKNIEFLGQLNSESVNDLLSRATASVLPSRWYENNPLGVIESLCAGTPVIGARIGGIPELIDMQSGLLYNHGNTKALAGAISTALVMNWDHNIIASRARARHSEEGHIDKLLQVYQA